LDVLISSKSFPSFPTIFYNIFYIFLCFLNGCLGWLVGLCNWEDTKLMSELEAGVFQSSKDLVGFLFKD
jgi:hypothetical protein